MRKSNSLFEVGVILIVLGLLIKGCEFCNSLEFIFGDEDERKKKKEEKKD